MTLWRNADVDKPVTDRDVLCIVSGRIRNITFDKAYMIGAYCSEGPEDDIGWIFEHTVFRDYDEYDKLTVHCWTELPKVPKALREEEG